MKLRWLCLLAAAILTAISASAQRAPAGGLKTYDEGDKGQPCGGVIRLDPNVVPIDTSQLVVKGAPLVENRIFASEIMRLRFPADHGVAGNARWYVAPVTLRRGPESEGRALGFAPGTEIQAYGAGEGSRLPAPVYVCGLEGVVIESYYPISRTAVPPERADILIPPYQSEEQALGYANLVREMKQLEVVEVPLVRPFDRNYDASSPDCGPNSDAYLVASTVTVVPRAVFEGVEGQGNGGGQTASASMAVFPDPSPALRRLKTKLEREAREFIETLRHDQRGRITVCYSPDSLELWSRDIPDGPKEWNSFWKSVEQGLARLVAQQTLRKSIFPQPPSKESVESGNPAGQEFIAPPVTKIPSPGKQSPPGKTRPQAVKGRKGQA